MGCMVLTYPIFPRLFDLLCDTGTAGKSNTKNQPNLRQGFTAERIRLDAVETIRETAVL